MKKMILLLFTSLYLMAATVDIGAVQEDGMTDEEKSDGMTLLLKQYDWATMWKEFMPLGTIKTCIRKGKNSSKKGMLGVKFTLSEPLYLIDMTTSSNYMQSVGLSIGPDRPDKTGLSLEDGDVYINVFKFPIMGMLLKGVKDASFFAFDDSNPTPVYFGSIDPKKWNDILSFSLIPEKGIYASIIGNVAAGLTCPLFEIMDKLPASSMRKEGGIGYGLREIVDPYYYAVGCLGPAPTGTITVHPNPVSTGILATKSVFDDLFSHKGAGLDMRIAHTTKNALNGANDNIFCLQKFFMNGW